MSWQVSRAEVERIVREHGLEEPRRLFRGFVELRTEIPLLFRAPWGPQRSFTFYCSYSYRTSARVSLKGFDVECRDNACEVVNYSFPALTYIIVKRGVRVNYSRKPKDYGTATISLSIRADESTIINPPLKFPLNTIELRVTRVTEMPKEVPPEKIWAGYFAVHPGKSTGAGAVRFAEVKVVREPAAVFRVIRCSSNSGAHWVTGWLVLVREKGEVVVRDYYSSSRGAIGWNVRRVYTREGVREEGESW